MPSVVGFRGPPAVRRGRYGRLALVSDRPTPARPFAGPPGLGRARPERRGQTDQRRGDGREGGLFIYKGSRRLSRPAAQDSRTRYLLEGPRSFEGRAGGAARVLYPARAKRSLFLCIEKVFIFSRDCRFIKKTGGRRRHPYLFCTSRGSPADPWSPAGLRRRLFDETPRGVGVGRGVGPVSGARGLRRTGSPPDAAALPPCVREAPWGRRTLPLSAGSGWVSPSPRASATRFSPAPSRPARDLLKPGGPTERSGSTRSLGCGGGEVKAASKTGVPSEEEHPWVSSSSNLVPPGADAEKGRLRLRLRRRGGLRSAETPESPVVTGPRTGSSERRAVWTPAELGPLGKVVGTEG